MKKDPDSYSIRAVDRAIAVLGALSRANDPQSLTAISADIGLNVPTIFRLIRTLEAQGLVMGHQHGDDSNTTRYTLGFRIMELSQAFERQLDITRIAQPFLEAARNGVNETVSLAVRNGDFYSHVTQAQSFDNLRHVPNMGERRALYEGAAGRVILAGDSDEDIEAYLARTTFRPRAASAPHDAQTLRELIGKVRVNGFDEGRSPQTGARFAVAVRDRNNRVAAAVHISGPGERCDRELWIAAVAEAALGISRALGYQGPAEKALTTNGRTTAKTAAGGP